MFSEDDRTSPETIPGCHEDKIPDDPHQAALALEISAHGIKKQLEECPPSDNDPLGKQIKDARAAAQMETDARLAFMIRQSEQPAD